MYEYLIAQAFILFTSWTVDLNWSIMFKYATYEDIKNDFKLYKNIFFFYIYTFYSFTVYLTFK